MFGRHPEFKIIGEAADGLSAVTLFSTFQPDVALIDLRLPGQSGIEAIRAIRASHPQAGLIAITSFDGDTDARNALEAGADGFLFKGSPGAEVLAAVRAVSAGGKWISDEIAALLDATGGSGPRGRRRCVCSRLGRGQRDWDCAGPSRADFRAFYPPAGRKIRGHGDRAGHCPERNRADGRSSRRGVQPRNG